MQVEYYLSASSQILSFVSLQTDNIQLAYMQTYIRTYIRIHSTLIQVLICLHDTVKHTMECTSHTNSQNYIHGILTLYVIITTMCK